MSSQGDRSAIVEGFIRRYDWIDGAFAVRFLAAGEYNENYLVECEGGRTVFRINHGTQLNLDNQIRYEFDVLGLVAPSGVTPRPLRVCEFDPDFPRGALMMEFLPGRPLDYRNDTDLAGAAECFARLHSVPYDAAGGPLLVQASPIDAIVTECRDLLARHPTHPLPEHGAKIRGYLERIVDLARRVAFDGEGLCIANTEVNSGNFVVLAPEGGFAPDVDAGTPRVRLVDWEKAVATLRYQDLGHFLVPTTTLWKTDYRFDRETRRRFLESYRDAAGLIIPLDELDERTAVLERTILLRAFSWVYMAYAEYTGGARPITNADTFETMKSYLADIDLFLDLEA